MTVKVEKVSYGGWDNCYKISNEMVELIVTSDVGPRIMRYSFLDGENLMCQVKEDMGKSGSDKWLMYGGHRLWHSPEHPIRTYNPDNFPVKVKVLENGVHLTSDVEKVSGIKKEMIIKLSDKTSQVEVDHILTNTNLWTVQLSVWALSVLDKGGLEVVPQETKDTGLLPNRMISLWPYTDLSDKRVMWGKKYIFLQQDPKISQPFKFGISNTPGWAAFFNKNDMYIKRFFPQEDKLYPDYSASMYETYTNEFMTEMETLSPLVNLKENESISHKEIWKLYKDVRVPKNEEEMDEIVGEYRLDG